jgi:hypothetical protein
MIETDTLYTILLTAIVGFALLRCGYILGRNGTEQKFLKLFFELEKAQLVDLKKVESWIKSTDYKA